MLVCEGTVGDLITWEDGFGSIEGAIDWLGTLEEHVGASNVDWEKLLDGLDYFSCLPGLSSPAFEDVRDLQELSGFHVDVADPEVDDVPGSAFLYVYVGINDNRKDEIIGYFEELASRIERYIEEVRKAEQEDEEDDEE